MPDRHLESPERHLAPEAPAQYPLANMVNKTDRRAGRRRGTTSIALLLGSLACVVASTVAVSPAMAQDMTQGKATVSVSLTVVLCPSHNTGLAGTPGQPAPVKVGLPSSLVGKVGAYGDGLDFLILAPKGWTCFSTYGDDGSGILKVVPGKPGQLAGQEVTMNMTGACAGCAMAQACPLFSSAARSYKAEFGPCPKARPARETVTLLSSHAVSFQDPPQVKGDGLGSGGRYPDNGLMTYFGASKPSELADCVLPATGHETCAVALKQFLGWWGNQ